MHRLKLCKSRFAYFPSDFSMGENIKNSHVLLCPAPSKCNGTSSHGFPAHPTMADEYAGILSQLTLKVRSADCCVPSAHTANNP